MKRWRSPLVSGPAVRDAGSESRTYASVEDPSNLGARFWGVFARRMAGWRRIACAF